MIWYKIASLGCGVEWAVSIRFLEKSGLMLVTCILHMKLGQCLTEYYHCVSELTCRHVGSLFWFQNVLLPMVAGRVQYYWHHWVSNRKLTSSYCCDCWLPSQSLWECFFFWRATLLSPLEPLKQPMGAARIGMNTNKRLKIRKTVNNAKKKKSL